MDKRIRLSLALCVGAIVLIAGGMGLINSKIIVPYVILGLAILALFTVLILLTKVRSDKA
jgi:uncharacterized membrane protein YkvI